MFFLSVVSPALAADPAWKVLPPLPDSVGFGGMFAGVADGVLFAGGGSRFLDKPIWHGGKKVFNDKVFVLRNANGPWEILADRLPKEIAHSASASWGEEVISVGGVNAEGALTDAYRIGLKNGALKITELPPLPRPLVYAAAAVVRDVIYVVGGVPEATSTQPSREVWTLSLIAEKPEWTKAPDFPGRPGSVLTAAGDGHCLYVFGGMHFEPSSEGKSQPVPLDSAYRYDPAARAWARLENLPFARVGAASPCPVLPGGNIFVAGGYGTVFPGAQKDHPGFERETLIYSTAQNTWRTGPLLPCDRKPNPELPNSPGPEPMIAAPAAIWRNSVVLISGEVRPSTRTPAVIAIPISDIR